MVLIYIYIVEAFKYDDNCHCYIKLMNLLLFTNQNENNNLFIMVKVSFLEPETSWFYICKFMKGFITIKHLSIDFCLFFYRHVVSVLIEILNSFCRICKSS